VVHLVAERYVLLIAGLLTVFLTLCMPVAADEHHISPVPGAIKAGVDAASSGDVIVLADGTYDENNIVITGKSLTFMAESGHSAADVTIDGGMIAPRIFTVTDGSALTIERITIQKGQATSAPDFPDSNGAAGEDGGAIFSNGPVTITSSVFRNCSAGYGGYARNHRGGAGGSGGAIRAGGDVRITDSTFQSCFAGLGGGGADGGNGGSGGAVWSSGTVTVISSSFDTCNAGNGGYSTMGSAGNGGSGGAIHASGTVTISGTSITGGSAGAGGAGGGQNANGGNGGNGGGVFTPGTVAMTTSSVTSCKAGAVNPSGGTEGTPGTGSAVYSGGSGGSLNFCRIYANQRGQTIQASGMNAENTWWGTSDGADSTVTGADTDPWLVLGIAVSPSVVTPSSYWSTVTADLNRNSDRNLISGSGHVLDGTQVDFSGAPGTVTPASAGTSFGTATGVFSPSAGGTATVRATVDGQSVTTTLNVIAPVDAAFSASPLTGTAPLTVAFTDESTGSPDQWAWNFGSYHADDDGVSSARNPTHIYDTAGTYTVTLTAKAGVTGDTETKVRYITVTSPGTEPIAAAFTADPPLTGDAPLAVQFHDTSSGLPVAWVWSFGDGGTSSDRNPSHTYSHPGAYTVTLTAMNGSVSGTHSEPGYVTVTSVDTPIIANFANATPRDGSVPLTVQFHDDSTGLPVAWAWSFGDGDTSSDRNPSHTYSLPGAYTVTLTAMNGSVSGTHAEPGYVTVTSIDTPVIANFANATPRDGTVPLTVQFTDTSAGLPVAWLWSFGDGNTSTDQHPSHTYTSIGSYPVTLTAVNGTHTNTLTQPGYVTVTAVPTPVPTTAPTAAPLNPSSSGGNSGTASAGSGGSDSGTGPEPVKQGSIVLFTSSAYLAEHSITPAEIRVMSYSGGRWTPLDTRFTGASGNRFSFTADTDTYSLLSLGNTKDGINGLPVIGSAATPVPTTSHTPATRPSLTDPENQGISREETPAAAVQQPVAAPPAPAAASLPVASSGFPLIAIIVVSAGCIVLIGGAWYARRWWIRRQNPALFREYD
jgi:PKD repeat protein